MKYKDALNYTWKNTTEYPFYNRKTPKMNKEMRFFALHREIHLFLVPKLRGCTGWIWLIHMNPVDPAWR